MLKHYYNFYFLLPFFILGLAFVVLLATLTPYYQPKTTPSTADPTPTNQIVITTSTPTPTAASVELPLKRYSSGQLGISFEYPQGFKLSETNGKIVLTNGLKVVFNTLKPDQITVDNFNFTITKLKGSLDSVRSNFYLDDNITISRGDHIILYGWWGVEGTGEKHYLLKLEEEEWLAISHQVRLDNDVALISTQKKGYLNNDMQGQIVDHLLSTLKIVKTEKELGYIKNAYSQDGNNYIDVDYIEWVNDPTAPNGYRIRNDITAPLGAILGSKTVFKIFDVQAMTHQKVSFDQFRKIVLDYSNPNSGFPYDIITKDNVVAEVSAKYVP